MDLFGKKKIEQLERDVNYWKRMYEDESRRNNNHLKEIELLQAKIRGERVCDGYCKYCINGVTEEREFYSDGTWRKDEKYTCIHDCKCKDFERKD